MIKKIDIYIIRKFLGTFFFIMGMIMAITIVIDMTEKIEDFIENEAPLSAIVFDYYLNFIPHMSAMLGPFFVFIACILFTSRMAGKSEIVAILASGTSYNRILVPYMAAALILASLLYVSNHYVVPHVNKIRITFEDTYINNKRYNPFQNVHRQISENDFFHIKTFSQKDTVGFHFSYEHYDGQRLVYKLKADKVAWLPTEKKWRLTNYTTTFYNDDGEHRISRQQTDTILPIKPTNFYTKINNKDDMTTPEIIAVVEEMEEAGIDNKEFFLIERYKRTSMAFSVFIFTLIGVSIASRKVRGGMGLHLVIGIAMGFSYELILKISTTFSTNADLSPIAGVWVPNVIYAIIAIYLVYKTPK